jgi:hypothetical protein
VEVYTDSVTGPAPGPRAPSGVPSVPLPHILLSPGKFDNIPQLFQFKRQGLPVIPLNLDDPILDRAAGAAALFQLFGQRFKLFQRQGDARDAGDSLAFTALGLPGYPHDPVIFRHSPGFGTRALGHGLATVWADLAVIRGIDQAGIFVVLHGDQHSP